MEIGAYIIPATIKQTRALGIHPGPIKKSNMWQRWFTVGMVRGYKIVRCKPFPAFQYDTTRDSLEKDRDYIIKLCDRMEFYALSMDQAKEAIKRINEMGKK